MNGLFRPRVPEFQIYPSTFPFLIFLTSTFKILATMCDISGEQYKYGRKKENASSFLRLLLRLLVAKIPGYFLYFHAAI